VVENTSSAELTGVIDFQPLLSKCCLNFYHLTGFWEEKLCKWQVFDHPQWQKWPLFDHIFGLKRDFDSSLRLRWKISYHFFRKDGRFSPTFLDNVVDFIPPTLK
jgi:hypothetical protein